jgi:hypothetical protein
MKNTNYHTVRTVPKLNRKIVERGKMDIPNMVFYTTFNNISVISWWSFLLMEESGGPGENHLPAANH